MKPAKPRKKGKHTQQNGPLPLPSTQSQAEELQQAVEDANQFERANGSPEVADLVEGEYEND